MHRFRAHIRDVTRDAHERLDSRMSALNLGARAGYETFLRTTAAALFPLEREIGAGAPLTDWPRRRRSGCLARDLSRLGLAAPPPLDPPPLDGNAQRLGALYVIEGSRLGGKMILKTVLDSGDDDMIAATQYLRHGETDRLFHSFLDAASEHLTGTANIEDAAAAARAVFALFEESLNRASTAAPVSPIQTAS